MKRLLEILDSPGFWLSIALIFAMSALGNIIVGNWPDMRDNLQLALLCVLLYRSEKM